MLNESQKQAFDAVLSGKNVFISSPAGYGKTHLIKAIVKAFEEKRKNVIVCAPTGLAALSADGETINRVFNFPAAPAVTKTGRPLSHSTYELMAADVIIIDEISMVRIDVFDSIVASLKKISSKGKHIQLIVCGDFYQLPPVVSGEDGSMELLKRIYPNFRSGFSFETSAWNSCKFVLIELNEPMRQTSIPLIESLNLLRVGNRSAIDFFNERCVGTPIPDAVTLVPTLSKANEINSAALSKLCGCEFSFPTVSDVDEDILDEYDIPRSLSLKEGLRVIFSAPFGSCCTGAVGTVEKISTNTSSPQNDYIEVNVAGRLIKVFRTSRSISRYRNERGKLVKKSVGSFTQFPLLPAHAITIHRAQGQSLDSANIDPDCFAPGQLYVALSRIRTLDGIRLLHPIRGDSLKVDSTVAKFYDSLHKSTSESVVQRVPTALAGFFKAITAKYQHNPTGREEIVDQLSRIA